MFSAIDLIWLTLLGGGVLYLWRSGQFKGRARGLAIRHCDEHGLQLLDHSMVISAIWPVRADDGRLQLRRKYRFEFSSTGDRRYQGEVVLVGLRLDSIELEAYKLPSDE